MKPITHRVQRANDASPLKQTRFKDALSKGKDMLNKAVNNEPSGPDYSRMETFRDYKSAASVFSDFNPGTDTVFVHTQLDPGVASKGASHKGRVSAAKGASGGIPSDQKMYRTTNESGQSLYTSVKKYPKK